MLSACASSTSQPSSDNGRYFEARTTAGELAQQIDHAELLTEFHPAEPLSWLVYVPNSVEQGATPGLLIFISPSDQPSFPSQWLPVLDAKNLVLIVPNRAGNRQRTTKRIALAVTGFKYLERRYQFDPSRRYLSGFSGGARTSGLAVALYPALFDGAIYFGGAEMWPTDADTNVAAELQTKRFVFITGGSDFNQDMTRRVWSGYRQRGIADSELNVIRHLGHELPRAAVFEAGDFLPGRQRRRRLRSAIETSD